MGILAQHVPSIEQLRPGLIEVIEESGGSKQFFCEPERHDLETQLTDTVSGGFAIVQPNSVLSINAVEGFPLEEFSMEAVNSQISEAQKIANGGGSEQDIAEAKIELEVRPPTANRKSTLSNVVAGSGEFASIIEVAWAALDRVNTSRAGSLNQQFDFCYARTCRNALSRCDELLVAPAC